jgi:hypothetical protein
MTQLIASVPQVWLSYAALLLACTSMSAHDVITLLMIAPLASYIIATDEP